MNWAYNTIPQSNADNREVIWPRGKGLGGMYFCSKKNWAVLTENRQLRYQRIVLDSPR
jgi:choline dehydrogenase-like flavoprotein